MDAAPVPTAEFSLASYDGALDVDRRDFSYAANELLSDATKLCREVDHRMVEPIHVAWVLFSGAACASDAYRELGLTILTRAGINHTKVLKFMEDEMQIVCEKAVIDRAPSFSAAYVKWMQEAQYEAQLYSDLRISIAHLAVALAMHLQYGEHVGFSERRFRVACERVRGVEPIDDLLDEEDEPRRKEAEQLTVDIDAALFKPDDQLPTKLDRISPASSAPDSPPESERRDSDPSIAEDELPRFTDDYFDSMTMEQQEDYWRAYVLREERERDAALAVDSDGSSSELSDDTLVEHVPAHRFVEYQPDDTGSVISDSSDGLGDEAAKLEAELNC